MSRLDISNLGTSKQITIEGDAIDITHRQNLDEDTIDLTEEPEFPKDSTSYRESDPIDSTDPTAEVESLIRNLPIGPLRHINANNLDRKWKLIEQLSKTLPLNEYNLPIFVYRADMLDNNFVREILQKDWSAGAPHTPTTSTAALEGRSEGIRDVMAHLDAAQVLLEYNEGYPTLPNGQPFWNQMDTEPKAAHDAFIFYLELEGVRRISALAHLPMDEVREYYHTYYWDFRVKAFDLYRVAHQNRLKIQRMLRVEDDHYRMASKIMAAVSQIVNTEEFADNLAKLDPEKLVSVFEKLVKVQRISVGLPVGSSAGQDTKPVAPSTTNIIMQQITQGDVKPQEDDDTLATLANDEEALEKAQDLILTVQQKGG